MKKLILTLFVGLSLTACNDKEEVRVVGNDGKAGTQLTLTQTADGVNIESSDQEELFTILNGEKGDKGDPGFSDTLSFTNFVGGVLMTASSGAQTKIFHGKDGKDSVVPGPMGPPGPRGLPGKGDTLTLKRLSDGVLVTSSSGSSAKVNDGKDGKDSTVPGPPGPQGDPGKDGKDGNDNIKTQVFVVPTYGKCVSLAPGIWAKNEGDHADIYNNDECKHSGNGRRAFCNDLTDAEDTDKYTQNEVCEVIKDNEIYQYTIQGQYGNLCIVQRHYADLPDAIVLD